MIIIKTFIILFLNFIITKMIGNLKLRPSIEHFWFYLNNNKIICYYDVSHIYWLLMFIKNECLKYINKFESNCYLYTIGIRAS